MPFTTDQFFGVFARYNLAVWPFQLVLFGAALAAIVLLLRGGASSDRAISGIVALLWAWMAIGYHFVFFTAINPVAWVFGAFFLAAAVGFAWAGVVKPHLRFVIEGGLRGWAGGALLLYSLVFYPLVGHAFGHRWPEVPTFGLPCPTTIFTLGLLVFAAPPLPGSVFMVPLLWSALGTSAAFQFHIPQDLGLPVAGLIGLVAMTQRPSGGARVPADVRVEGRRE
jgi:uncharacterized protein DUF6064